MKTLGRSADPQWGGRSMALDPFVVTKHQPSNGLRAWGHPGKIPVTLGANGPHPLSRTLRSPAGVAVFLRDCATVAIGGPVCEADAQIIAVACEAADYSPNFRENPEMIFELSSERP
jgi:hypothetical protein